MKKQYLQMVMACLLLVCFYFMSREAAMVSGVPDSSDNNQTVVLVDAGHGGMDPGMIGIGELKEKGINLSIALKLKEQLIRMGYQVFMTRESDEGLYDADSSNKKVQDMQKRIEMIDQYQPALTVSIHQNSYPDAGVKGPQVFYYEHSEEGMKLAQMIQEQLHVSLSVERPREAKGNTTYYLLKRSPGILNIVECGFLTNPREAELLQTEEYQQKVAEAVALGIDTYLKKKSSGP